MFRPTRMLAALTLAMLAACPVLTRADEAKDEAKKLEGDWKVVSADSGGRVSDKTPGPQQVVIRGDQITLNSLLNKPFRPKNVVNFLVFLRVGSAKFGLFNRLSWGRFAVGGRRA
jgi:hypothetical protein